jgi:4,5-dihydroxyphthalate decarboxylase
MIAGFLDEIRSQGLAETDLTPDTLFPPLENFAAAA